MGTEMFKDFCSEYFTKTEIYMDIHIWGLQRMVPKRWVHSWSDYLVDARGHQWGMEKLITECSAAENHTGRRASPNLNHQRLDEGLLDWRVLIPAVTFSINNSGCCWRNAWRILSQHIADLLVQIEQHFATTAYWLYPISVRPQLTMSQSFNLEHLLDFNWGHSHQISFYKRRLAVWWDGRLTSGDLTNQHKLCDSITSVWKTSEESFKTQFRVEWRQLWNNVVLCMSKLCRI